MGYDAVVLLSFGGPEGPDDVIPFLENVTRGRGIPPERLAEVAEHYRNFGGVSPINQQCRDLLAAIRRHGTEGTPTLSDREPYFFSRWVEEEWGRVGLDHLSRRLGGARAYLARCDGFDPAQVSFGPDVVAALAEQA